MARQKTGIKVKKLDTIPNLQERLKEAKSNYDYQDKLTKKLDKHKGLFTYTTLLEIVLWKTNRYPEIDESLIEDINDLRKKYNKSKARNLLLMLLSLKGFDLPMASTILRFAVPDKLQIIDQRVYRLITSEDTLKKPSSADKKADLYFDYIDILTDKAKEHGIRFREADRLLYQLDKMYNKNVKLKTS
jgi:thermostable 8-oxoguanine DNA glycosylase